jgi:hypothetical protein
MKQPTREQHLELARAVEAQANGQLSPEQLAHIKKFVETVGGIENARQALLALDELQKAA